MGNLKTTTGGGSIFNAGINASVIGALDVPYSAAYLGTGDQIQTDPLENGEPGEFGGLQEFAVEFLVLFNAALPTGQSILFGPGGASGFRQYLFEVNGANQIRFSSKPNSGASVVTLGQVVSLSEWYHIIGTLYAGTLYLYVNGALQASGAFPVGASVEGSSHSAGSDFAAAANGGAGSIMFDEWSSYRHGLSAARVKAHYDAARNRGFGQHLPGERIGAALDAISSHAPRSLQAGTRPVIPRYMSAQSPLEEIRLAIEAEDVDAVFFAEADGGLTFLADGHRSAAPYNAAQATFGNAGGSELPYLALESDYSMSYLENEWSGARTPFGPDTPVTQTVSDATSIATYFRRAHALGDIPVIDDADVLAIVTRLLAKYKDPLYMLTAIEPKMADADTAAAVYGLELMYPIRVLWTPPGGGSRIDQTVYIQQIEHSGTPNGPPHCRLTVTPL